MNYDHTIAGLIRKRNEIFQECETATNRIATIKNDILAIDRVLKVMGFEDDANALMTRPYMLTVTRRGDVVQTIKDELKNASQPLHSRDLARAIITFRGMDHRDRKYAENVRRAVSKCLRNLRASQLVCEAKDQAGETRWIWSAQ